MVTLPRISSSMALAGQTLCVLLLFFPFVLWGTISAWDRECISNAERMQKFISALGMRQTVLTSSTRVLLTTLSFAPVVRENKKVELLDFLKKLDINQPDYAGFAVFCTNGETVASVLNGRQRQTVPSEIIKSREYFQMAMRKGRFTVGESLQLPEKRVVLLMSMPVRADNGTISGLVLAPLDMNVLDTIVHDLLNTTQDRVLIFDRFKHRIYRCAYAPSDEEHASVFIQGELGETEVSGGIEHPDTARNTRKLENTFVFENMIRTNEYRDMKSVAVHGGLSDNTYVFEWQEDNKTFVGAVRELYLEDERTPYMYLAASSEQIHFLDFVRQQFLIQLLGLCASIAAAIILSRYIGKYYFKNGLDHLARVSLQTLEGDLSVRAGDVPGCLEIGILASAFDHMLSAQEANTNALMTLSRVDALTGLWNRRRFTEMALIELGRAVRYDRVLAIVMLDIDKFKHVNDTYGHSAGDDVLRVFARTLYDAVRGADIVARFGGEEFIFLLPETNGENAFGVMERIRRQCETVSVPHPLGNIHFTASFGIASLEELLPFELCGVPENASDAQEVSSETKGRFCSRESLMDDTELRRILQLLIKRADTALYHAKETGRNRTSIWCPDMESVPDSKSNTLL